MTVLREPPSPTVYTVRSAASGNGAGGVPCWHLLVFIVLSLVGFLGIPPHSHAGRKDCGSITVASQSYAAFGRQKDLMVAVMPGPLRLSLARPRRVVPVTASMA